MVSWDDAPQPEATVITMMPPTPDPQPMTQLELAESRLAADVEALASIFDDAHPATRPAVALAGRVAVQERRVRSLRALPHHREADGAQDARWDLTLAYEHLAFACDQRGDRAAATWARELAIAERHAIDPPIERRPAPALRGSRPAFAFALAG